MIRSHTTAAALFLAALACSDRPGVTGPTDPIGNFPNPPSSATITGIVVVEGNATENQVVQLLQRDGSLVLLVGSEAAHLAAVAGGEVSVRGTWDAPPGLVVESFQVLSMNGRAALDGVLEATDDGLALRLVDGSYRELSDAPAELFDYVGFRLWITGSSDEPPVDFGVIEAR